jgi:hypothetical protein
VASEEVAAVKRKRLGNKDAAGIVVLGTALLAGVLCLHTAAARAQEEEKEVITSNEKKLAAEFNDPLTTLPQIFMQDAYTPANYGTEAGTNKVILRAIVPRLPRYSLLPFVQLVRPSVTLVTVPTGRGAGTRTEFGDMQLFDLGVIPWPGYKETGLLMGVGPVFIFPTATYKTAGQEAWQVGPAFGAIYKGIPGLVTGCLIQNPISFAYTSSDAQRQSSLAIQPIVLTYVGRGFYIKSADSTWTISWQHHTATVIPVSFGIGKVLIREGLPPLNFFVTGEWTAYRQFAPIAPQTTVRFGLTVAFPDFRPWS